MFPPFEGLFADAATTLNRFTGNRHVISRVFQAEDLNESARRLFSTVDVLLTAIALPDFTLLTTIELDLEAGKFPEMLAAFFSDPEWSYERRYCIGGICKDDSDATYRCGRLTIESEAGQIARLLAFNGGIRWGAGLQLGGVQVPTQAIGEAIRKSPFGHDEAVVLAASARVAWAAHRNLNELFIWTREKQY